MRKLATPRSPSQRAARLNIVSSVPTTGSSWRMPVKPCSSRTTGAGPSASGRANVPMTVWPPLLKLTSLSLTLYCWHGSGQRGRGIGEAVLRAQGRRDQPQAQDDHGTNRRDGEESWNESSTAWPISNSTLQFAVDCAMRDARGAIFTPCSTLRPGASARLYDMLWHSTAGRRDHGQLIEVRRDPAHDLGLVHRPRARRI